MDRGKMNAGEETECTEEEETGKMTETNRIFEANNDLLGRLSKF